MMIPPRSGVDDDGRLISACFRRGFTFFFPLSPTRCPGAERVALYVRVGTQDGTTGLGNCMIVTNDGPSSAIPPARSRAGILRSWGMKMKTRVSLAYPSLYLCSLFVVSTARRPSTRGHTLGPGGDSPDTLWRDRFSNSALPKGPGLLEDHARDPPAWASWVTCFRRRTRQSRGADAGSIYARRQPRFVTPCLPQSRRDNFQDQLACEVHRGRWWPDQVGSVRA